jgi:hypothetical protein
MRRGIRERGHDGRTVSLLRDHLSLKYRGKLLGGEVAEAAEENLSLERVTKETGFCSVRGGARGHLGAPGCYHNNLLERSVCGKNLAGGKDGWWWRSVYWGRRAGGVKIGTLPVDR